MTEDVPGFSIRPAGPADVALVLRFVRHLAEYERAPEAVVATEETLREALFDPRPAAEAVLASLDGEAVGFAVYFTSFSTWLGRLGLYLEDLFVLPEQRGRGFGRALLRHLARIAVKRGCGRMDWAVLDWNEAAIGFYRGLGAEAMDDWTTYRLSGDALRRLADS